MDRSTGFARCPRPSTTAYRRKSESMTILRPHVSKTLPRRNSRAAESYWFVLAALMSRKGLLEPKHRAEQVSQSPDALDHPFGVEHQKVRVGLLVRSGHFVPGYRCRDRWPRSGPQAVDADHGLVFVVLAPIDQHLACPQGAPNVGDDQLR